MKHYLLLIGVVFSQFSFAFQGQQDALLNVSDVLALNSFADRVPIAISPDEKYLAYTSTSKNKRGANEYFDAQGVPRSQKNSAIYIVNQLTHKTQRLVDSTFVSWGPSWSPDGKLLAFYANIDGYSKIWLWDLEKDTIRKVSEAQVRPFWGFEKIQWSADGRSILVKLLPEDISLSELKKRYPDRFKKNTLTNNASPSIRKHESNFDDEKSTHKEPSKMNIDFDKTPSFLNVQYGDLTLINVKTSHVERIAKNVRAMNYVFSNSGKKIAFSTRQPDGGNGALVYGLYDLWTIDLETKKLKNIASKISQNYGLGFSLSPDDRMVAYTSHHNVHVLDLKSGKEVMMFGNETLNLSHDYRPPLWKGNKSLMVIAKNNLYELSLENGQVALFISSDRDKMIGFIMEAHIQAIAGDRIAIATINPLDKSMGVKFIHMASKKVNQKYFNNAYIDTDLTYYSSSTRNHIYFLAESATHPQDIWRADYQFKEVKRITKNNPITLQLKLGKSVLIDWEMENGKTLQGALLLPSGYISKKKYPLVVKVYGGSMLSNTVNKFGLQGGIDNLQLLATRGYAVLLVDAPTSKGTPMENIADAVYLGAMRAVALGYADPERMAVFGHSYGGYSAISTAVNYSKFKTVICSGGFSNLFTHYTKMRENGAAIGIHWSENSQGKMMGHPWEYFDQYKRNSPFFYLDNVSSSVLILHGGSDPTVLTSEAEELFIGLRRLKKKSRLLIFANQGHHPGSWDRSEAIQYWDEIFKWLETEL